MTRTLLNACLILAIPFVAAAHHPGHHDHAETLVLDADNWEEHVPHGKEVDAIYGDAVILNPFLTAVVAEPLPTRNANMTVRNVGGALIDLTTNRDPSDQLSAFYPDRRKYLLTSRDLSMERTSSINSLGETHTNSSARIVLGSPAGDGTPAVELEYRIGERDRFLTVISRYRNPHDAPLTVELEDDLRADAGNEDMIKSPNGTHDFFWIHDTYWGQAYGFEVVGRRILSQSDPRNTVLKYVSDGESKITLPAGESFELVRRIYPGRDLLEVKANWHIAQGRDVVPVEFHVRDGAGEPIAAGSVAIDGEAGPVGGGRTDARGFLTCALPPGRYSVHASALGVKLTGDSPLPIEIPDGTPSSIALSFEKWNPGRVAAKIVDADGKPIPCKVAFHAKAGTPKPYFGPKSTAFGVVDIYYTPNGEFVQQLPSGEYEVIVSRGPEYNAVFTELQVEPGKTAKLQAVLQRTVQTPGWVSADFHSHSSPSGDNTGSQLGRVLSLVCEHIEFAPCTEHNRIDTYVPHIRALKLESFVTTVSGMELTGSPLPLNHQNAFPLIHKPRTQDGGGPVTDTSPEVQIERLLLWDDRSEKLIQQNHPDIGWLFFDKNGDGVPDEGFERSHGLIDVMEIHPIHLVLDLKPATQYAGRPYANRVFGWLQLLNQGYRIPGVVNTDAHYNYHESGGLRNWIQSSTDDAGKIDITEMIHASEAGRLVMSNGPYLEFSVREAGAEQSVVAGSDLTAKSKKVAVRVRVQCPNWFDVDRVFLLVNGREHSVHNYRKESSPGKFRDGIVKFEEELLLELDGDAHIIAVAGSESTTLGRIAGPLWGAHNPAAVTNPVFVDVDGDGFTPNKDTLDHPLPVKFVAP